MLATARSIFLAICFSFAVRCKQEQTLISTRLLEQDPTFWLMQGSITADSFCHYRLELAVDLTEEEEDCMVH